MIRDFFIFSSPGAMGRRHGANCTNGSVYTYHEKAKDKRESGWGSLAARLGKDSMKVSC